LNAGEPIAGGFHSKTTTSRTRLTDEERERLERQA
jgi:hypothetical protein